jgi:broad specificity phosphatase PhoE
MILYTDQKVINMILLSIRHGEQLYPYNEQGKKMISGSNAPLVDLGRKQMRDLREALDKKGIVLDAVYMSPFLRAKQSKDELVGKSVPIYVVNDLREGFPDSDLGATYEELEERGGDIYALPFSDAQEKLEELVQRSREAKEFILNNAREKGYKLIAIIGHGDPLCALDWVLKHEGQPANYAEIRDAYYPQKAQAREYIINDENLELKSEGRLITPEASEKTVETFRGHLRNEAE